MIRPEITIRAGAAKKKLRELEAKPRQLRPVMLAIGERLVHSTKQRFADGRGPDGQPWAQNSPVTILNYLERFSSSFSKKTGRITKSGTERAIGKPPLIGESKSLSRTINYRVVGNTVLVGSPMIYAATQHFGAKRGQFGTTRTGRPIPWGDIPARPFLGLSDDDRQMIVQLTRDHLGT